MSDQIKKLRVPLMMMGLLFILAPLVDIITNALPFVPGDMRWRFASLGIASNYLISVVFGAMLLGMLAVAADARIANYVLGALWCATAVIMLVLCVIYLLDTFQLLQDLPEGAETMYSIGAAKSVFKVLFSAAVLGTLGVIELRVARHVHAAEAAASDEGPRIIRKKRSKEYIPET
jgi:hypothetical protein